MTAIRYFIYFAVVIVVFFAAVLFVDRNQASVVLDLFGLHLEGYSFGLWLLVSFAVGAGVGMFAMTPRLFRVVTSNKQLQRKLNKATNELHKTRGDG